jgi:hypothetical protein
MRTKLAAVVLLSALALIAGCHAITSFAGTYVAKMT